MKIIIIDRDNIEHMRKVLPSDQAEHLVVGCITWTFYDEDDDVRGTFTIWPDNRGAVCWDGPSFWGRWEKKYRVLRTDPDASGRTFFVAPDGSAIPINDDGEMVIGEIPIDE